MEAAADDPAPLFLARTGQERLRNDERFFLMNQGLASVFRRENNVVLIIGLRDFRKICSGAREIVAAHSLYRLPRQRPATATNRDSRPSVGVATGARFVRDGVTGSACDRGTTSLIGTWPVNPQKRDTGGEGDLPSHPAAALPRFDGGRVYISPEDTEEAT